MSRRKRRIVVETTDLVPAAVVSAADLQNGDGTKLVLAEPVHHFVRLKLI